MKDEDRKRLTEFLGECWHEIVDRYDLVYAVCSCGDSGPATKIYSHADIHRPFTTEADMMALYRRLHKAGKWDEFVWDVVKDGVGFADFCVRLFRLSGEGYEERCRIVADFLKGEKRESR